LKSSEQLRRHRGGAGHHLRQPDARPVESVAAGSLVVLGQTITVNAARCSTTRWLETFSRQARDGRAHLRLLDTSGSYTGNPNANRPTPTPMPCSIHHRRGRHRQDLEHRKALIDVSDSFVTSGLA